MQKRTEKINIRVTPTEVERMKRVAKKYGLTLSDYIRRMVLLESGVELEQTIEELNFYKHIGTNIARQTEQFLQLSHAIADTTTKLEKSVNGVLTGDMFGNEKRPKRVRTKKQKTT